MAKHRLVAAVYREIRGHIPPPILGMIRSTVSGLVFLKLHDAKIEMIFIIISLDGQAAPFKDLL